MFADMRPALACGSAMCAALARQHAATALDEPPRLRSGMNHTDMVVDDLDGAAVNPVARLAGRAE